jgi:hypothetical protein
VVNPQRSFVDLEENSIMKKKTRGITTALLMIALISILFSACRSKEPEIDINAEKTSFAVTAIAQATMTAQSQPTATPTLQPSPTETGLPESTATVTLTPASVNATTAAPISGNDLAAWLSNDPPDNTVFRPGEEFTVTWTLENTGTSTWTTNYYIMFASGAQMGATEEKVYIPYNVAPGTNVKISVDFIAPETNGEKQSIWRFYNANDQSFYEFYVIIKVSDSAEGNSTSETVTPTITEAP